MSDPKAPRKPNNERPRYEPPRVIEDAALENLSLTCGKIGGLGCLASGGIRS